MDLDSTITDETFDQLQKRLATFLQRIQNLEAEACLLKDRIDSIVEDQRKSGMSKRDWYRSDRR